MPAMPNDADAEMFDAAAYATRHAAMLLSRLDLHTMRLRHYDYGHAIDADTPIT